MINVFLLGLVIIPLVLAQIGRLIGIWQGIDWLYTTNIVLFWTLFVVSRVAYSAIWGFGWYWICATAERFGFFWFKPEHHYSNDEESRDWSGIIIAALVLLIIAIVIGEMAIRFYTLTPPIELPARVDSAK
ncbi:MAG: hypothetical protein Q8L51_03160 [Candidatus Amesbacteria bacterium]|nr:hypothetical protein [Candidatus Amesbacteria bacterium]